MDGCTVLSKQTVNAELEPRRSAHYTWRMRGSELHLSGGWRPGPYFRHPFSDKPALVGLGLAKIAALEGRMPRTSGLLTNQSAGGRGLTENRWDKQKINKESSDSVRT